MSYSRILIQRPSWLYLQSPSPPTTRQVVCCCPWSGSGSDTNRKDVVDALLLKTNNTKYENTIKSSNDGFGGWRLPPGPSLLDLIGLLHYLVRSLPYHYPLRDLADKYGPLLHFQVGELHMIIVSSAEMAKEVLKAHDIACAYRPKSVASEAVSYGSCDVVMSPYGDYWKQMRHICITELLSAKNVQSSEYIRRDQGKILIESIKSASRGGPLPLDLTEKITWFMNSMMCRVVFGNASMDMAATIRFVRAAMDEGANFDLVDLFPSIKLLEHFPWNTRHLLEMMPEMDKILDDIIDKHARNVAMTGKGYGDLGNEDFVDVLLRLKETNHLQFPITNDAIKAVIVDILTGGTESVSTVVDWTMVELMRNPRVMAKVQAEIREAFQGRKTMDESEIRKLSYLKLVVKETMRLHPPNAIIPRTCDEDLEINGYQIPRKAIIGINIWMIGRDPRNWSDPERFEPERFEGNCIDYYGNHFEYTPFGSGKRMCPGIALGVASIEYALVQFLYYYNWKLPPGMRPEDLDMIEAHGFSAPRKSSLNVIAVPYRPAFAADG